MITELLKKYDLMRKDMKVNGMKNFESNKSELDKMITTCFTTVGEKETIKVYQNYVRNYK